MKGLVPPHADLFLSMPLAKSEAGNRDTGTARHAAGRIYSQMFQKAKNRVNWSFQAMGRIKQLKDRLAMLKDDALVESTGGAAVHAFGRSQTHRVKQVPMCARAMLHGKRAAYPFFLRKCLG